MKLLKVHDPLNRTLPYQSMSGLYVDSSQVEIWKDIAKDKNLLVIETDEYIEFTKLPAPAIPTTANVKSSPVRKPRKYSDEAKAKMSASRTGKKRKPFTDEHRANMSAVKMGKKRSQKPPTP